MSQESNNRKTTSELYVHPHAIVEPGARIGRGTKVWAFTHVLPKAVIGEDCNLCDHVFIENQVSVGNRVTIKCGVQLWDGVVIEDDVFIGPNVTFTNDAFPRSKQHLSEYPKTIIRKGASIGANSTILPGLHVGQHSMIGAGAVVTKDVPPYAIVVGNPARIKGYVASKHGNQQTTQKYNSASMIESSIEGVKFVDFPVVHDLRGDLSFGEYDQHLPFIPNRYFIVYNVPTKQIRGEHAHKKCHQLLICVSGSCTAMVDDGNVREEYQLNQPHKALYVPPMVWAAQFNYSKEAVLLVLASDQYDPDDYVRDYSAFLSEKGSS